MSSRLIYKNHQQVSAGSGRTSLYLLLATILFIGLMIIACLIPDKAGAQSHDAVLAAHQQIKDSSNNVLNLINDSVYENEYNKLVLKFAMSASAISSDSGNEIKRDGINGLISLAWKAASAIGVSTVGAFLEGGSGTYESSTSLRSGMKTYGDGQSEYYGGGLFINNIFSTRTYMEASLRGGYLDNSYDIKNGGSSKFNASQAYYGAHLGVGQKFDITPTAELDLYLKGIWARTEGKKIKTNALEYIDFDNIDSLQSRLGARMTQSFKDVQQVKAYFGAAWEYEFDGKLKGRYISGSDDRRHNKSEGSTAIGELGIIIDPEDSILALDFGVFGMAGQQKGIGGTAGLKFEF